MTAAPFTTTSATLVQQALRGDESAARRLAHRLNPVLRARARGLVGPNLEDLVQHVWLRLFERDGARLRAYDPSRGVSLETYVGVVARRLMLNELRASRATKRTVPDFHSLPWAPSQPDAIILGENLAHRLVADIAASLPDRGRQVLWHCFLNQQSAHEAARIIGASRQVVYNWQHQIRLRARAFLEAQAA